MCISTIFIAIFVVVYALICRCIVLKSPYGFAHRTKRQQRFQFRTFSNLWRTLAHIHLHNQLKTKRTKLKLRLGQSGSTKNKKKKTKFCSSSSLDAMCVSRLPLAFEQNGIAAPLNRERMHKNKTFCTLVMQTMITIMIISCVYGYVLPILSFNAHSHT